jgi:NAD-dependent SIR2 family protein deacetylase
MILIGTTGEVYPAATVPQKAFDNRATIIEILKLLLMALII